MPVPDDEPPSGSLTQPRKQTCQLVATKPDLVRFGVDLFVTRLRNSKTRLRQVFPLKLLKSK